MNENVKLAEYNSIRNEIQQLNSQIFTIFSIIITANLTIFGWIFSKDDPQEYIFLILVCYLILLFGNLVTLNRNRLAHRLAYYQQIFIESNLNDINWSTVYFKYLDKYKQKVCCKNINLFYLLSERLARSISAIIILMNFINLGIVIYYHCVCKPQWFLIIIGISIIILNIFLICIFENYKKIKETFDEIYKEDFNKSADTSSNTM